MRWCAAKGDMAAPASLARSLERRVRRAASSGHSRHLLALTRACTLFLLAGCMAACGQSPSTPAVPNHLHDLLALQGMRGVVLLATHDGVYRTSDDGTAWSKVAGASGQPMAGMMVVKLTQSPRTPSHVFALAIPRAGDPRAPNAAAGIYASGDSGLSWREVTPLARFPEHAAYTIDAGATGAEDIFALAPERGLERLYVSHDAGAAWQRLAAPEGMQPRGVASVPGHPAEIALWGTPGGLAFSDDEGVTWRAAAGIPSGEGVIVVALAEHAVYASADDGLYRSLDGGRQFARTFTEATFTSLAATSDPERAYALTGSSLFVTADRGQAWRERALPLQRAGLLAPDPNDPNTAYVGSLSPLTVAVTHDSGATWQHAFGP